MLRDSIKIIFLGVFILYGWDIYLDRLSNLGLSPGAAFYLVLFSAVCVGLVCAAFVRNTILRLVFAVSFFASSVVALSYQNIVADFLTYNAFISMIITIGFINEALDQYSVPILESILVSFALLLGIWLKPGTTISRRQPIIALMPVVVLVLLLGILFVRGGNGAMGLPPSYTALSYAILSVYESYDDVIGERRKVAIERDDKAIDFDIVLIIDESISPLYLDIDQESGVESGLAAEYRNREIFNYGYGASITHCSAETNLTIRYGGTRENYLSYISTMPSIWAYAKQAQLETVYIDSQRTHGILNNQITAEEFEQIDKFIQFDDIPILYRDMKAAEKLIQLTSNDTPEFILVNKLGAHFPIHDKFPDSHAAYKPILPRGRFIDVGDTGSREGFSGRQDDWRLYRNSYRNTVSWNVGEFFNRLLSAEIGKSIFIYTSDHGQNLHEDHSTGLNTHCSAQPEFIEGMVPVVVIEDSRRETLDWRANLDVNWNHTSHYNIFPTLLALMHYDLAEVEQTYGRTLSGVTADPLTFNTNFHARLGEEPEWMRIRIDDIPYPSEDH